ncbi:dehydrodolichyl diphosphate synthase complex subunit DHDDS-like [Ornithodoros turicata]|uniref:dehydrodolichyl diphosphate synthase complex subunit DHDDS-like n=1 Tax=Ornithodoros turicata TaxID=34597 RepID=UPI00313921C9
MLLALEVILPWYERLLLWLLSLGPTPRNLAIIPDGNRRYAKKVGLSANDGHVAGRRSLQTMVAWAEMLGAKDVTIYTFSTHNFKRPKDEFGGLFEEIQALSWAIINNPQVADKKGVRTRCVGDLDQLPRNVQRTLAKLELITSSNREHTTNYCIAYSARHQLTRITKMMAKAVKEGLLRPDDITPGLVEKSLAVEESPEIEVLYRTSGETRLSDFLLWQSNYAMLYFEQKTIPEVSFWDFVKGVLYYQVRAQALKDIRQKHYKELEECSAEQILRQRTFLLQMEADRVGYLRRLAADE